MTFRRPWFRTRRSLKPKAERSAGLIVEQREALDELARAVVMVKAGATPFFDAKRTQWWGLCEWCRKDGKREPDYLSWCHIRTRNAAPLLVHHPLNAWAGCNRCHMGRQHDVLGIQDDLAGIARRQAYFDFIAAIRSKGELEWLMSKHVRPPGVTPLGWSILRGQDNVAELRTLTSGHIHRALRPEHRAVLANLLGDGSVSV